ncbi:hypothetical protein CBR_g38344 [Chara braunii]|uniref:Integrase catalytic domain-containing protein n=1 Tax=Chara braunii TaxID=69332 RepID=A0A388LQ92_CHABU|nr:hypothetical protein CBR_g38344 [Chara braunii]|eukprot:GBG84372.1 hypothetical protein CBR_g38344 [Chara braunii]
MKTQPVLSDALKGWIEVMEQYDFEPQYIKGEYNKVVDALLPRPDFLGALVTEFGLVDDITRSLVEAYREDPFMAEIYIAPCSRSKENANMFARTELWKAAAAEQGTQLQMTSNNHPEANGQAEQLNHVVQHLLWHYIKPNQVDWDEKLALIASLYNNAVHSATGHDSSAMSTTSHRNNRSRQCMVLTRSKISGMEQQPAETTETYEGCMLNMVAEFKQQATAATSARKKEQRRLAEQQREADAEAARKTANERHRLRRDKLLECEGDIEVIAGEWAVAAEEEGAPSAVRGLATTIEHVSDLVATCAAQQDDILCVDTLVRTQIQIIDELLDRVPRLERQLATTTPAGHSNLTDRVNVLEIDVGTVKDGALTTNQRIDQQICAAAVSPTVTNRESIPKFDGLPIFCGATAWHKRFQVEPPELQAAEKLQRPRQIPFGKVSTAESDAAALSTPSEAVALRATSLHSEAHAEVDSPLLYSYEDYAAWLVPSMGSQAQGQDVCSASSPSDNNNNISTSSGSSSDSTHEFNIEVLDPLTSEDFAWLPLPSTGCLPGLQCATLCAHLHTYLAFYAPPSSPSDDEAAVGDILAYVTKVAREFRMQRYDDNNAPLLYVRIQVGQASCSALLDSGTTRNFISQSFIQKAGLGTQVRRKPNPTTIKLADDRMQQLLDYYIEVVPVYFAPHACKPVTFDVLDTDFDIILGMPWLASADHTVNFHHRTLTVRDAFGAEVPCTIPLPHSSIRCQVVTAKSFRATCPYERTDEIGLCFLRAATTTESSPTDLSSDPRVVRLLGEFTDMFESPTGVVPDRPISHEIILQPGVVQPKGCIYRMSEE